MSEENKGREFWHSTVYDCEDIVYHSYEKALENAWMADPDNVTHVIEYSAFEKCQAEKERLKKQLAVAVAMFGTGIESPRNLCALMAEGEGDDPEVYKQMARAAVEKIDSILEDFLGK